MYFFKSSIPSDKSQYHYCVDFEEQERSTLATQQSEKLEVMTPCVQQVPAEREHGQRIPTPPSKSNWRLALSLIPWWQSKMDKIKSKGGDKEFPFFIKRTGRFAELLITGPGKWSHLTSTRHVSEMQPLSETLICALPPSLHFRNNTGLQGSEWNDPKSYSTTLGCTPSMINN